MYFKCCWTQNNLLALYFAQHTEQASKSGYSSLHSFTLHTLRLRASFIVTAPLGLTRKWLPICTTGLFEHHKSHRTIRGSKVKFYFHIFSFTFIYLFKEIFQTNTYSIYSTVSVVIWSHQTCSDQDNHVGFKTVQLVWMQSFAVQKKLRWWTLFED